MTNGGNNSQELLANAKAWFDSLTDGDYHHDEYIDYGNDPQAARRAREFQRKYYNAGFVGPSVPIEYGGLGLDQESTMALNDLAAQADLPDRRLFVIGQGMCVPTILKHGTDEQKARYIRPILDGSEIWCQLFSEPGAGSDLAGVSTQAKLNDDGKWVVNGQKVWTSNGRASDFGILLAKTDMDAPKHQSLTMFIVKMDAPGVEIRPLRQITGESEFNEVFLEDLILDSSAVIGQVGDGWKAAITTLTSERQSLSLGKRMTTVSDARTLSQMAGVSELKNDALRLELLDYHIRNQAFEVFAEDMQDRIRALQDTGSMSSVAKLESTYLTKKGAELGAEIANASGSATQRVTALDTLLRSRNMGIAGGTDNIQRNIIAERILGLPK